MSNSKHNRIHRKSGPRISATAARKIRNAERDFKAGKGIEWRKVRQKIDDILTEALKSGKSTPMTRKDWDQIRTNGLKRARARRKE